MGSGAAQIHRIQPYQADKIYICPGCNQEIRPGTGHLVVVPVSDPSSRRHWHSPCWEHRGAAPPHRALKGSLPGDVCPAADVASRQRR